MTAAEHLSELERVFGNVREGVSDPAAWLGGGAWRCVCRDRVNARHSVSG